MCAGQDWVNEYGFVLQQVLGLGFDLGLQSETAGTQSLVLEEYYQPPVLDQWIYDEKLSTREQKTTQCHPHWY